MNLADAVAAMNERGIELFEQGPGRVHVDRLTDLSQVQALRQLRALLPQETLDGVRQAVDRLGLDLHGIELVASPAGVDQSPSLWKTISQRLSNFGKPPDLTAGAPPAELPTPRSLLVAAEAWLLVQLAPADSLDAEQLTALASPWLHATVTRSL